MEPLRAAVLELEASPDIDRRELSQLVDRLQALLCRVVRAGVRRGDHLVEGKTPNGWVASTCRISGSSAADRLRVGEQLDNLPQVAAALRQGEIGYQATSLLCHLSDLLGEKREQIDEAEWIGYARQFSIKNLRRLTEHARSWSTPREPSATPRRTTSSATSTSASWARCTSSTRCSIAKAEMALKTALESLTKRLGPSDERTPKQRRADVLKEIVFQALDQGTLPRRHGVRPHLTVHTTLEGWKGELADGMPIGRRAVQRLACDSVMHRVVKAESMVIDVGRAKRTAQPAQWRALKARHTTCAAPGCERPLGWTQAHHVEFWSEGGKTNAHRLVPLCHFHHRLVHEGRWQVVRAGERVEFIPPETPAMTRRRWGERRWAA